jgi:hypothetical protein
MSFPGTPLTSARRAPSAEVFRFLGETAHPPLKDAPSRIRANPLADGRLAGLDYLDATDRVAGNDTAARYGRRGRQ